MVNEKTENCSNCDKEIVIGEDIYTNSESILCSIDCLLDYNNIKFTVLEECWFK